MVCLRHTEIRKTKTYSTTILPVQSASKYGYAVFVLPHVQVVVYTGNFLVELGSIKSLLKIHFELTSLKPDSLQDFYEVLGRMSLW